MFGVLTIHASRDNFLLTAGRQAVWTPSLPKPCTPPPQEAATVYEPPLEL